MQNPQCWIGVVSREHVMRGVEGGFIQLNHGKRAPLQRLQAGDRVALYSPREAYPDGAPLQAFTAIGEVVSGEVYQVEMAPDFKPYRVDVRFLPCEEASIRPLIEDLSFIRDKTHWGAAFRFGYVRVPEADFLLIAQAMRASFDAGAALPKQAPRVSALRA
ncbi:EVE domain-containing protein [Niveibacterium sp. SC-1]|uniref:EVE domain-containing protein n=1 Tax=Niveibacterium sp. SC-1 TaxID=3135646 RepID=UPI00311D936A